MIDQKTWNIRCGGENCNNELSILMYDARYQLIKEKQRLFCCSHKCSGTVRKNSYILNEKSKPWKIPCGNCGKEVIMENYDVHAKLRSGSRFFFCSVQCSGKQMKIIKGLGKRRPSKYKLKHGICEFCGKEFEYNCTKIQKYCSHSCYSMQLKKKKQGPLNNPEIYRKTTISRYKNSLDGGSDIENIIWKSLDSLEIKYEKNFPVDVFENEHYETTYFIDAAILSKKIAIECDGEYWHENNKDADALRDVRLKKLGWVIIRFPGKKIKKALNECMCVVENLLKEPLRPC